MTDEQTQLSEDYPSSFNKDEFEKIKSFQGKLNYAVTHLKKLSSGSGRAVFIIDDKKVLKIAKNKKGLAQNEVESQAYTQTYEITSRVYDKGRNDFWLEMEFAKKLTPTIFKQITGVSIQQTSDYIEYVADRNKGGRRGRPKPENMEELDDNEFLQELWMFASDFDMGVGDLGRLNSYGEINRDGKPYVVLVDFGLTNEVYDDYYKVGPRKQMY